MGDSSARLGDHCCVRCAALGYEADATVKNALVRDPLGHELGAAWYTFKPSRECTSTEVGASSAAVDFQFRVSGGKDSSYN